MALNGTNGADNFKGTIFNDEVFGFAGNDDVFGSPGSDTIDGGADIDTVSYAIFVAGLPGAGPVSVINGKAVNVDLERATQFGGFAEGDVLINVENISGSEENDVIKGDSEANKLNGDFGDDILEGRGGNDELLGSTGDDHVDGGADEDIVRGGKGSDTLIGGLDDDQLFGDEDNDTLFGDAGFDRLDGGAGVDTASYANSAAGVAIFLNAGIGSGGDAGGDLLVSIENVTGSSFADTLVGSAAANVLSAGFGNDTLAGLGGADTLTGGAGVDTVTYAASGAGVTVDLLVDSASGGDATGDSLNGIENLTGSNFTDSLAGGSGTNLLNGGGGVDLLAGRLGNDIYIVDNAGDAVIEAVGEGNDEVRASASYTLTTGTEVETLRTTDDNGTAAINLSGNAFANQVIGNNGNNAISGAGGADTLIGARGVDTLNGGSGADRFVWRDIADSGTAIATMDLIVDFDPFAGDLIDLSGVDGNAIAGGNQAFTFIGAADFSDTPGEVSFIHLNGETIIQLQTGVENDIEMGIRIAGIVTPEASWFVL